jgi:cytochrome c-type biogenesis protein CcmH/NrfF
MIEIFASDWYLPVVLTVLGGEVLVAVWLRRLCRRLRDRHARQRAVVTSLSTSQIRKLRILGHDR